jgi:hypothetical protein
VDQHRLPDEAVALADYKGWSLYGALWLQPVAVSRKSGGLKNRRNTRKPLPWVASGCLRMVRSGSPVRIRKRALQKAPLVGASAFRSTCRVSSVRWVWSRLWIRATDRLGTTASDSPTRSSADSPPSPTQRPAGDSRSPISSGILAGAVPGPDLLVAASQPQKQLHDRQWVDALSEVVASARRARRRIAASQLRRMASLPGRITSQ